MTDIAERALKIARQAAASTVQEDEGLKAAYLRGSHDESPRVQTALAAVTPMLETLARWEGLGDAIRQINGDGPDWPAHGNVPLAIAAGYKLMQDGLVQVITFVGEQGVAAQESAASHLPRSALRASYEAQAIAYENVAGLFARLFGSGDGL